MFRLYSHISLLELFSNDSLKNSRLSNFNWNLIFVQCTAQQEVNSVPVDISSQTLSLCATCANLRAHLRIRLVTLRKSARKFRRLASTYESVWLYMFFPTQVNTWNRFNHFWVCLYDIRRDQTREGNVLMNGNWNIKANSKGKKPCVCLFVCVCVCVCVWERERERERNKKQTGRRTREQNARWQTNQRYDQQTFDFNSKRHCLDK